MTFATKQLARPVQRACASAREHAPAHPQSHTARGLRRVRTNDALGRVLRRAVLARMTTDEAIEAADSCKAPGSPEEIREKAAAGQRFDPVLKTWIAPGDEATWDKYWSDVWKRSGGRAKMGFEQWATKQAEAAKKKAAEDLAIAQGNVSPWDLAALRAAAAGASDEGSLLAKRIWGAAARFDKHVQAAAIGKMFEEAGYTVKIEESVRTSSWTPPVLVYFTHPVIKNIEVHPGGGIHGTVRPQGKKDGVVQPNVPRRDGNGPPYIRIETKRGAAPIKIRNKALPEDANYDDAKQHAEYVFVDIPTSMSGTQSAATLTSSI